MKLFLFIILVLALVVLVELSRRPSVKTRSSKALTRSGLKSKNTKSLPKGPVRKSTLKKTAAAVLLSAIGGAGFAGADLLLDKLLDDDEYQDKLFQHFEENGGRIAPEFMMQLIASFKDHDSRNSTVYIFIISGSTFAVFIILVVIIIGCKYQNNIQKFLGRPRINSPM